MTADDLILLLDKRFAALFAKATTPSVTARVKTPDGLLDVTITRRSWAKCHGRFDRWTLLREHLSA